MNESYLLDITLKIFNLMVPMLIPIYLGILIIFKKIYKINFEKFWIIFLFLVYMLFLQVLNYDYLNVIIIKVILIYTCIIVLPYFIKLIVFDKIVKNYYFFVIGVIFLYLELFIVFLEIFYFLDRIFLTMFKIIFLFIIFFSFYLFVINFILEQK